MIKHIKKFKDFKVNEVSEFNLQRLNQGQTSFPMPNVADPQLSINAFDKHQDAIRAGTARINNIMASLSNTAAFQSLKSKLSLEEQDISSIKILRIVKSDSVNYDVYISFIIGEKEYWGQINNILERSPSFISEVFKDSDLIQAKEWTIKIKGLIIKSIKTWLNPEIGRYILLNSDAFCYGVDNGRLLRLEKTSEVDVIRSFDNKILIKYNDEYYNLVGDNYIYFNYWFVKKTNS